VHGVRRAVQRPDVLFGEVVGRRVGPRQHAYLPGLAGLGVRRAPGLRHGQPRRGRSRQPQQQQVARLERAPLARSAPAAHHITGMLANGPAASTSTVCTPERPEAAAPQEGCLPRPAPARPRPLAAAVGNGDERLDVQALAGRPACTAAPDPGGPGRGGEPGGPGCRPGVRWGTWRARPGMRAWPGRPPWRCSTARPARAPAARRGQAQGCAKAAAALATVRQAAPKSLWPAHAQNHGASGGVSHPKSDPLGAQTNTGIWHGQIFMHMMRKNKPMDDVIMRAWRVVACRGDGERRALGHLERLPQRHRLAVHLRRKLGAADGGHARRHEAQRGPCAGGRATA